MRRIVEYVPMEEKKAYPSPGFGDFLIGLFVGCFLIAPFIWTPLGRELTKTAIARGAEVTKSKVEEWIAKGEKK